MNPCLVFVSSTTRDLVKYREVAVDVISKVNVTFGDRFPLVPVSMDTKTLDGERTPPLDDSRRWVRECDWLVLIVAWNYGYVPPGQTVSVTEWEYIEATNAEKNCFVFLAGESSDPQVSQYWPTDRAVEGLNLAEWRGHPDHRSQEKALVDFKKKLRERRFSLFSNIEDFRVKLTATLTNKIIAELFRDIGPQIAMLGLRPPLEACFGHVKVLARLKRLHDRLHRIRHFGIRRWRDIVLTRWPDDAELPSDAKIEYLLGLIEIRELAAEMRVLADELPADLCKEIPSIDWVGKYRFPDSPNMDKRGFAESTEIFASRVQKAFTGCNTQMERGASRLDRVYQSLTASAREALQHAQMASEQRQVMKSELDRAMQVYQRLQQILKNHSDWQRTHDEFERIDTAIETHLPDRQNDGSNGDDEELERQAEAFRLMVADFVESEGAEVRGLLDSAAAIMTQDNMERLKIWPGLILRVRNHLDVFVAGSDVQHYQAMRTAFDELFFEVDTETLQAVEASEDRVRAMKSAF